MPGLSFLFKKAWHPARLDNQKNVFIQENTARSRQEREAEAAKEVAKEEEIRMYERAGDVSERDPRASSLKFMYAQPKATGDSSSSRPAPAPPPTAGTGDDDEDVKRFWSRLTGHEEDTPMAPAPAGSAVSSHTAVPKNLVRQPTTLEKQLGIRPGEFLNKAQMEERHPRLKNAPVDGGAYTANIAMSHKPFNDLVRNVRCVRCGEWGHVRGDRECSLLHEVSAADLARQRQEDPLNSMHSDIYIKEKQKLVLRKAIAGKRPTNGISADKASLPVTEQLIESDEEGVSDPEGDFLMTLTKREKKLLLKKLEKIQRGQELAARVGSISGEDSTSSSSSDSATKRRLKKRKLKKSKNRTRSSSLSDDSSEYNSQYRKTKKS